MMGRSRVTEHPSVTRGTRASFDCDVVAQADARNSPINRGLSRGVTRGIIASVVSWGALVAKRPVGGGGLGGSGLDRSITSSEGEFPRSSSALE